MDHARLVAPGAAAVGVPGIVHVHSSYSHDGLDSLATIRDRALAGGIRFVAMTDHAEDFDAARFAEYCAECATLSDAHVALIPGLEFRFAHHRGLHLLALGLARWIEPPTPEAFIIETTGCAGLTVMAHPGLAGYHMPVAVRERIGAIEVWNAAYNTRYLPDPRAIALLSRVRRDRPGVVALAGLDQHNGANDRGTRVVLVDGADLATPLEALRAGRFVNRGRTMSFDAYAEWTGPRLGALVAARVVLDTVERAQDRLVRVWRRRRAPRP
jgi:hypothetical protein